MLETYKEQGSVERELRFLKDPRFELNHVFLQKPARIEALMMVMTLCLLVSNLGEYNIRQGLKDTGQTVMNKKKKPTQKPTLRWISQLLRGVITLFDENDKW